MSRELDAMRKRTNAKLEEAKKINRENSKKTDKELERIQYGYQYQMNKKG